MSLEKSHRSDGLVELQKLYSYHRVVLQSDMSLPYKQSELADYRRLPAWSTLTKKQAKVSL